MRGPFKTDVNGDYLREWDFYDQEEEVIEGLQQIFSNLGILGRKQEEEVVVTFRSAHRTLQQSFMRVVIIPILRHLADQYAAGNLDGRNMASGRLASLMLKNLNDDDLYLPFV